jgi:hypothetical protein
MPAWIAGIQVARMLPETTMLTWIPALHAGMTQNFVLFVSFVVISISLVELIALDSRFQKISHDAMDFFRFRIKVTMPFTGEYNQLGVGNSLG